MISTASVVIQTLLLHSGIDEQSGNRQRLVFARAKSYVSVTGPDSLQGHDTLCYEMVRVGLNYAEPEEGQIFEHDLEAKFLVPDGVERVVVHHGGLVLRTVYLDAHQLNLHVRTSC